ARVFALTTHPYVANDVAPLDAAPRDGTLILFHYGISSPLSALARQCAAPLALMYHNITPPEYFATLHPEVAAATRQARAELGSFRGVRLALANSEFSRRELVAAGYERTGVAPVPVDPAWLADPDPAVMARFADGRANLLFVGRFAPNKRQHELVRLLAVYQRIDPTARLILVGGQFTLSYRPVVERMTRALGLTGSVVFTDHVTPAQLAAYYRCARVFVSFSAHEGFGAPLIEAMAAGVPVVAYAAAAVPETVGDAAILIHDLSLPVVAEAVRCAAVDGPVRDRLIARGRAHAARFHPDAVAARFAAQMAPVLAEVAPVGGVR
ncbi:MAG: glycosyltransferase family 4 protein, partial [Dehalococcoidia bacterium]|nr:glycosyltransferase family 4 protein [Dehalococcoidia bacterium]